MRKTNIDINNIPAEKFAFATEGVSLHDTKLKTKPRSYMKDAWTRFKKNKSSVAAAIIIGFLILYSIIVPVVSPYSLADTDLYYKNLPAYTVGSEWLADGANVETVNEQRYFTYKLWEKETGDTIINKVLDIYDTTNQDGNTETMYKIRLNQYTKIGIYTWTFSVDDFIKMQKWQDETGIQLIYPMTNTDTATLGFDITKETVATFAPNYYYKINKTGFALDADGNVIKPEINKEGNVLNYDAIQTIYRPYSARRVMNIKTTVTEVDENGNTVEKEVQKSVYQGDLYQSKFGRNEDGTYDYEYYRTTGSATNPKDGTPEMVACRIKYSAYFQYTKGYTPYFLFGTEINGRDIFTSIAIGARFSLLLAVCVSFINFVIGMIYGSIEGYYGGAVDLTLERISDILSGVPFTVVVSLLTFYAASPEIPWNPAPIVMLVIAFIATGWIGTASLVRKQFYRFKGQEYVTVAKSLGAKDTRIMFKHILPNSLGTIVTSTALMIPGVISSETMLTYLNIINLNSNTVTTVGIMLSEANSTFSSAPHAMIIPSLYLALMLISFNLFGNGLRDAFNPSLRGSED